MERYILFKNARIVDCAASTLTDSDILVRQANNEQSSEIVAIGSSVEPPNKSDVMLQTVNLHGQLVCPSFTDMRCDVCEPGNRNREDYESLGKAAAAGGFGTVVALPISLPSADALSVIGYIKENSHRTGGTRILPCAPISSDGRGTLSDLDALSAGGAVAFGDLGDADASFMMRAMRECAKKDLLIIMHCEDKSLSQNGVINDGPLCGSLGLTGISPCAEEISLARNLLLAAETGCKIHISHISTARSTEMIRSAKKAGVRVTCDTSPQYFSLTDGDIYFYSSNAKVSPPLRSEADRTAIIEAIRDGTIDCICSDHAPRTEREKPHDLTEALPGIIGLQSAFTLALDRLVMDRHIDIFRLVSLFTDAPASIIGHGHKIAVGEPAYLNVFSLDCDTFFQTQNSKSKSKNSPFLEMSLRGCLTYSLVDGRLNINPDVSVF